MLSRSTQLQQTNLFIEQMFRQREAMRKTQDEIATGLKVARPSDDPGHAGAINNFRNTILRVDAHVERIDFASSSLTHQEGLLESVEEILFRAKEIAAQAANGPLGASIREDMASEVFQLREQYVNLVNSQFQGRYIYGGLDDDDPPVDPAVPAPGYTDSNPQIPETAIRYVFDPTTGLTPELGQDQTRSVAIADNESVRINTPAEQIFANGLYSLERLARALTGFESLPPSGDSRSYCGSRWDRGSVSWSNIYRGSVG